MRETDDTEKLMMTVTALILIVNLLWIHASGIEN